MENNNLEVINKKSFKEKVSNFFFKTIISIVAVILILLTIGAVTFTADFGNAYNIYNEHISYTFDNIFINILLIIVFLLGIFAIYTIIKKIPNKYLISISIVIYAVLSVIWIIFSKTPLRADQRVVEETARQFLNGNYEALSEGQYLFYHPMQLTIVYFIEFIYKIFGQSNILIIKLLNVVFSCITIMYLYKIVGKLFEDKNIQKIFVILITLCFMLELFNVYVYGNIVGLMFGIMSIYYAITYISDRKVCNLIFCSLLLILSIILKSNFQVYLIGIFAIFIIDLFKRFDCKTLIAIVCVLVIYSAFSNILENTTEKVTNKEVPSGTPMIAYIYMGIAPKVDRASGWYNMDYNVEKIYWLNGYDSKKTSEYSKQEIKSRISDMLHNPKYTLIFYGDKVLSTWIEPSFQTIWINEPQEEYEKVKDQISENKILISIYDGKINKILNKYFDIYDIIIYVFAAVYIFINIKNIDSKKIIMLLIFFGGFLFHILWETKSIYALPFFILLIPYSAAGIYEVFNFINNKKKREEK